MLIPILLVLLLLDSYVFNGLNNLSLSMNNSYIMIAYWLAVTLTAVGVVNYVRKAQSEISQMPAVTNLLFGLGFSIITFELFYSFFLISEDVFRVTTFLGQSLFSEGNAAYYSRNPTWSLAGIGIASLPLMAMVYGVVEGKYKYTTRTVRLKIKGLPKSFNGFKLVQFSDAHLGSFDSIKGLRKGIAAINNAEADLILFTGDMVNNLASEAQPYLEELKELKAKYGKFSILGNHDYGAYVRWESKEAQKRNLEQLKNIESQMGFKMLNNEHALVELNAEKICIAGVENWGKPPFPQYGDLDKALNGVPKEMTTVLLSHDPSHWDLQVKNYPKQIDLTLSGHTHGMQFGIDLPFFKWSPVKWKYPKWAGMYQEAERYLYVNRGFGFLGFPGRAGIWPEITVIELNSED